MPTLKLPVVYSQWDSRWANNFLGFNTQLPYNFYNFACLITCLAMVAKYYGKDWDPVKINDDFKKMGAGKAFAAGSGNYIPGGFNLLFGDIKENRTMTPAALNDQQIGEIKSSIDAGHPVMIQLDVNPKTVQADQHFVLIIGYNPADENDFTIADPLGGKIRSLKDYLGWYKPSARSTIEQYTRYTGKLPAVGVDMITVGKDQWELMRTNHDKWHQIVHYLQEGLDPNATLFENARNIIAGIKSRASDFEAKLNTATGELAIKETEIKNKTEEVSRVRQEVLDNEKIYQARIDALNASIPNTEKLRGQLEGEVIEWKNKHNEAMKRVGTLELELATCKNQAGDVNQAKVLFEKFVGFIVGIVVKFLSAPKN